MPPEPKTRLVPIVRSEQSSPGPIGMVNPNLHNLTNFPKVRPRHSRAGSFQQSCAGSHEQPWESKPWDSATCSRSSPS